MAAKETRILMGMPVTVEVVENSASQENVDEIFDYFQWVDETFSTFKEDSEISRINRGEIALAQASEEMQTVFALSELTRQETDGYFDIERGGHYDPSGLVKGWAIYNAAGILRSRGFGNFYVEAGGDIEVAGKTREGRNWRVGIRNPFNLNEIVKVLSVTDCGVATSGTYVRGQHIYNPKDPQPIAGVVSMTVVGPNIYDADRFATAAFAMGRRGILFLEELDGFEGYMIDENRQAIFTTGFEKYTAHD